MFIDANHTEQMREMILRAFPSQTYEGTITTDDDALDDPDLDDHKYVYEELKGKQWPDLSHDFLDSSPDGFVLLTEGALRAYLAAWLMRALDESDGGEHVRDYIVYAFSPTDDMVPDLTAFRVGRIRCLTPDQRVVLRSLLIRVAESDPSEFQKTLARGAVELIDAHAG